MENIRSDEALRVWVITHLSDRLGNHAILKGGMVLRLLDCPRYTNDLDYIFIPFTSKKDIIAPILAALKELEGVTVHHRTHSTNAQFDVILENEFGTYKTQVEANVATECASQSVSTTDLATQYDQTARVIRVMRFDMMLAHKLAAWNERRLMRDLFDAYFMVKNMSVLPDLNVLQQRLQNIRYAKGVWGKNLPKKMTLPEFYVALISEAKAMTPTDLENELRDYLEPHQMAGLGKKILIALNQMIEALQ